MIVLVVSAHRSLWVLMHEGHCYANWTIETNFLAKGISPYTYLGFMGNVNYLITSFRADGLKNVMIGQKGVKQRDPQRQMVPVREPIGGPQIGLVLR